MSRSFIAGALLTRLAVCALIAALVVGFGQIADAFGGDAGRDARTLAQVKREVAVLLCSHHWYEDGSVVHEDAEAFRQCIATYNRTSRVP